MSTVVVKDGGGGAAAAIMVSDDVANLEFAVDTLSIDVTVVARNVISLESKWCHKRQR